MIAIKRGKILKELFARPGVKGYIISIDGEEARAIVYPELVGEVLPGDEVLVNTTAVELQLGSGGYHYVIASLQGRNRELTPGGHIMKLRYTPMQLKVLSVEEEASPFHQVMQEADSLENTPVLVSSLHSMLLPLCLQLKEKDKELRLAYIMTDGAALPLAFSRVVDYLKREGLLQATLSVGHAFGGDLEAVNIYSGLLAARHILQADIIIVGMGPGIVGTGTKWGFTGIEQGEILNAVEALEGRPVAVPRISFADKRKRHQGISHHTLTVLSRVCRVKALVPLPLLEEEKMDLLWTQIREAGLLDKYHFTVENEPGILDLLNNSSFKASTMGRGVEEEKEFFLALGAAAQAALSLYRQE